MKIEANCPNCGKSYRGHQYTNVNLSSLGCAQNDAEKYSVFNEWQENELLTTNTIYGNMPGSSASPSGFQKIIMEENPAHLDYYREFEQKQYSKNPFV